MAHAVSRPWTGWLFFTSKNIGGYLDTGISMSRLCIEVLTGVMRPLKKKSSIKKATVLRWLNEVEAIEVVADH